MLGTSVPSAHCKANHPHWVLGSNASFFQSSAVFSLYLPTVFADKEMPFGLSTDHLLLIVSAIFPCAGPRRGAHPWAVPAGAAGAPLSARGWRDGAIGELFVANGAVPQSAAAGERVEVLAWVHTGVQVGCQEAGGAR